MWPLQAWLWPSSLSFVYRISSAARPHGIDIADLRQASKQYCSKHLCHFFFWHFLGSCVGTLVACMHVCVCVSGMCFDTDLTLVYNLISLCN